MTVRAKLHDGRILEFPDDTDPVVIQSTVKKLVKQPEAPQEVTPSYDPLTTENLLGAATEPMMTVGSGVGGAIVGGLHGLGTALSNLGTMTGDRLPKRDYGQAVRDVQESMTYQPRTGGGRAATEVLTAPFRGLHHVAQKAGERVLKDTDSPAAATVAQTILEAAPMVLGARAAPSGKPAFLSPKVEAVIKAPVTAPLKLAGKGAHLVKEAILNRLPGGVERAAGEAIIEMLGPRLGAVVEALTRAKEGETAGQAAVPAGSYEFSALQKLAESRDPSGYGAIHKGQQAGRVGTLKEWAKTPEELAAAKAELDVRSGEAYGKVQKDLIDPRSNTQKIADAAMKAREAAEGAKLSKGEALRDWGRFKTLEQQQAARGARYYPAPGQPKAPPRYAPHTAVSKEAKIAAAEAKGISAERLATEQSMTGISESMLVNTIGEKGAPLGKFLSRPSIQKAVEAARNSAAEKGSYFPSKPGDKFSVANLQRIKRAVAENLSKEAKEGSLGKTEQAEITGTLNSFTGWLRNKSEGFKRAEDMYAKEIQPINQMKVGQALVKKLEPKLGAEERATQFATAIENANKLVKTQTGKTRPLQEVLTPEQMNSVNKVMNELNRDVELKYQAGKGAKAMNEAMGTMFDLPKITILERSIVIMNALLKKIEGKNVKLSLDLIAKKMKNPKEMAELLKEASPAERAVLNDAFKAMQGGIPIGGAAAMENE